MLPASSPLQSMVSSSITLTQIRTRLSPTHSKCGAKNYCPGYWEQTLQTLERKLEFGFHRKPHKSTLWRFPPWDISVGASFPYTTVPWCLQLIIIQLICHPEEVQLLICDINLSFYCTFMSSTISAARRFCVKESKFCWAAAVPGV